MNAGKLADEAHPEPMNALATLQAKTPLKDCTTSLKAVYFAARGPA
jgi:hypothetical protein